MLKNLDSRIPPEDRTLSSNSSKNSIANRVFCLISLLCVHEIYIEGRRRKSYIFFLVYVSICPHDSPSSPEEQIHCILTFAKPPHAGITIQEVTNIFLPLLADTGTNEGVIGHTQCPDEA